MKKMECKYWMFFSVILMIGCKPSAPSALFESMEPEATGIDFNNAITETDSFNILTEEYIFNGGGVAVGDFNLDGKPDLFFTGNQVANKLYLNLGGMKFEDVSQPAGIEVADKWCTGVVVVDINDDGLPDIYVCAAMNTQNRNNLLFVHQGLNDKGIPVFEEQAAAFGLAEAGNSMAATFFDYDRDGLLDLYVLNNEQSNILPGNYREKITDGSAINNDQLYRNNGDGTFTNVTQEAGINIEGFGLGVAIADFNLDGWPDIYICNDYLTNDLLYINNGDGTFSNQIKDLIRHQSMFSMGVDVADFNNDGLTDIITLDMLGETNYRKKTTIGGETYARYINNDRWGYEYQHVRNMLQLNNGSGVPFSEMGMMAGVYQTDWSWSPLFMDVDNDGFKDLIVTNGFPRDITDKDFADYRADVGNVATIKQLLDSIPIVKIPNYAFKNNGDLSFTDSGEEWGLNLPSFSNGAVYVDLDGDGDLDYVVNNINDRAFVFRNRLNDNEQQSNFLRIKLNGPQHNKAGIGTKLVLEDHDGWIQYLEQYVARGYMSSVEEIAHFGLGRAEKLNVLKILWPDGKYQEIASPPINTVLEIDYSDAKETVEGREFLFSGIAPRNLLQEVSEMMGLVYTHQEDNKIDFNLQRTIPHKLTQFGPGLAVGDINGDGLDDLMIGGAAGYAPQVFLQQQDGSFSDHLAFKPEEILPYEDMGLLFLDIDNDGDLDLYAVSGSNEFKAGSPEYKDRIYINDGKGNFSFAPDAIPEIASSGTTVRAADIDGDGLLDLFVGGRTPVGQYPYPDKSYLLKNDGGVFRDVTDEWAPGLRNIGMVTDAIWTDFDGDGKVDLIVVGDYMPITPFKNTGGRLEKSSETGIENHTGWWNSIVAGDFDGDGDIDYIVGNMGHNNLWKPSPERPVTVIAKDFDNNGSVDPVTFAHFKNDIGSYEAFPVHFWNELYGQSTLFRRKFDRYKSYARSTMATLLTEEERNGALMLEGNYPSSSYLENLGNGKFKLHPLPSEVQMAPVNGMVVDDINGDGHLDVLLVGNDYGNEIFVGRLDALTGGVLLGDGKGGFLPMGSAESGFLVPGDAKALVCLHHETKGVVYIASQNRGPLRTFALAHPGENPGHYRVPPQVSKVVFELETGKTRSAEVYYGSGFLSQSSRMVRRPNGVKSTRLYDFQGNEVGL
ncbi:VCBS repeat-containing protein [Negadavirga shengliensis]|uniref:VCBS repeat-containing protein n=1 Tax=Negadavirga shengliensis TaxID=1389218 RepID=A0ABV9T3V8_9BACT